MAYNQSYRTPDKYVRLVRAFFWVFFVVFSRGCRWHQGLGSRRMHFVLGNTKHIRLPPTHYRVAIMGVTVAIHYRRLLSLRDNNLR